MDMVIVRMYRNGQFQWATEMTRDAAELALRAIDGRDGVEIEVEEID